MTLNGNFEQIDKYDLDLSVLVGQTIYEEIIDEIDLNFELTRETDWENMEVIPLADFKELLIEVHVFAINKQLHNFILLGEKKITKRLLS